MAFLSLLGNSVGHNSLFKVSILCGFSCDFANFKIPFFCAFKVLTGLGMIR